MFRRKDGVVLVPLLIDEKSIPLYSPQLHTASVKAGVYLFKNNLPVEGEGN